jgi:hypothetical protein
MFHVNGTFQNVFVATSLFLSIILDSGYISNMFKCKCVLRESAHVQIYD